MPGSTTETLPQPAPAAAPVVAPSPLLDGVDRLIDAAPSLEALQLHGIVPLAIERWRARGRDVPADLAAATRAWSFVALSVRGVLAQARAAHDGPIVIFKGPAAAAMWPGGARSYIDIDLMVEDAEKAQRDLVAHGFVEVDDPDLFHDIHHLQPLQWPGLPLEIELHSRPKWPDRLRAPSREEIVDAAGDAGMGVDGILLPSRAHHTMLLASHGWAHSPLRSLRDLLDVAFMSEGLDRAELEELAHRWDLERVWRTTARAIDHVVEGRGRRPAAVRLMSQHLIEMRERTVFESHMARWLGAYWGLPFGAATAEGWGHFTWDLRPLEGESRRDKLSRMWQAMRRSGETLSRHHEELGEMATRGDLRRVVAERRSAERP